MNAPLGQSLVAEGSLSPHQFVERSDIPSHETRLQGYGRTVARQSDSPKRLRNCAPEAHAVPPELVLISKIVGAVSVKASTTPSRSMMA